MFAWGRGDNGQLGSSSSSSNAVATPRWSDLIGQRSVQKVASGRSHTLILLDDGTVESCGSNDRGQLGRKETSHDLLGALIIGTSRISHVACGHAHSVAVDDQGRVYSWGDNQSGQLGVGSVDKQASCPYPRLLKDFVAVVQVMCGANHTLALAQDGTVYSWGINTAGQLGHSYSLEPSAAGGGGGRKDKVPSPVRVRALDGQPVVHIATGRDHSFAVTISGAVFGWGRNSAGQLGLGNSKTIESSEVCALTSLKTHYIKFISCGAEHTAALTQNGGVFTFGQGAQGQLGHGNAVSSPNPRMIQELMGSPVCQLACGSHHTLVLVKSQRKVYAFGLNDRGQLGTGGSSNLSVPTPVVEAWSRPVLLPDNIDAGTPVDPPKPLPSTLLTSSLLVRRVLAGAEQSFVTVDFVRNSEEDVPAPALTDYRVLRSSSSPRTLTFEQLKGQLDSALITKDHTHLLAALRLFLSSRALLNGSFLAEDHHRTSDQYSGVDVTSALQAFALLRERTRGKRDITTSCQECVSSLLLSPLPPSPASPPTSPERLRLFYLLPALLFPSLPFGAAVLLQFVRTFLSLEPSIRPVIGNWLFCGPRDYLLMWITTVKEEMSKALVKGKHGALNSEDRNRITDKGLSQVEMDILKFGVSFLAFLHECNQLKGEPVDHTHFHLPIISETTDLLHDYIYWLHQEQGTVVFCSFPFLLDAQAKAKLMEFESAMNMHFAVREAQHANIFSLLTARTVLDSSPTAFQLTVQRGSLVRDTLNQLMSADESSYRKPLKVVFEGEEGEDVGGVQKEFFMLLLQEILNPDFGMFVEDDESHFIWFREQGSLYEDNLDLFVLIGILCGLAIYNATIIDLPFPCALYKKLLDKPLSLDDLTELRPSIGAGLKHLLDYQGDDFQSNFELVFALTRSNFGVVESVNLIEKGSDIPVTKETRGAYVEAYVDYVLVKSVKDHFEAFKHGFHRVCGGGKVLGMMHPKELMSLVVGRQVGEWGDMEKYMQYSGGYTAQHPSIVLFWKVFNDFPSDVKKRFLVFMTGCNRIPIAGIKSMKMHIQFMDGGPGCERLPVAHTCFNVIDLPPYKTELQMKSKLLQAINFTAGFGLL